jgi:hypothetical protein
MNPVWVVFPVNSSTIVPSGFKSEIAYVTESRFPSVAGYREIFVFPEKYHHSIGVINDVGFGAIFDV